MKFCAAQLLKREKRPRFGTGGVKCVRKSGLYGTENAGRPILIQTTNDTQTTGVRVGQACEMHCSWYSWRLAGMGIQEARGWRRPPCHAELRGAAAVPRASWIPIPANRHEKWFRIAFPPPIAPNFRVSGTLEPPVAPAPPRRNVGEAIWGVIWGVIGAT